MMLGRHLLSVIVLGWDRENEGMMLADALSFLALTEHYTKPKDV
jgi:hypothetical protein